MNSLFHLKKPFSICASLWLRIWFVLLAAILLADPVKAQVQTTFLNFKGGTNTALELSENKDFYPFRSVAPIIISRSGDVSGTSSVTIGFSDPSESRMVLRATQESGEVGAKAMTVEFQPGQSESTPIYLHAIDDSLEQAAYGAMLALSDTIGGSAGGPLQVLLFDDDSSHPLTITPKSTTVYEGKFVEVTLSREHRLSSSVTVAYSITHKGTSTEDFLLGSNISFGTEGIPAGETTNTLLIPTAIDDAQEGPESFTINFYVHPNDEPFWRIGNNTYDFTLQDSISISFTTTSVMALEGQGQQLTLVRSGSTAQALIVPINLFHYSSSEADFDPTNTSTEAVFAAGQSQAHITIFPVDDGIPDNGESVRIEVNPPSPYVGKNAVVLTINDAGDLPLILFPNTLTAQEGDVISTKRIQFTISEIPASPTPWTLELTPNLALSTASITGTSDFFTIPSAVNSDPGGMQGSASIRVRQDMLIEGREILVFDVTLISGAVRLQHTQIIFTIDDDDYPTLSLGVPENQPTTIEEGDGLTSLPLLLSLSTASPAIVTAPWTISGDFPTARLDATSGTVTFAPGEVKKTIYITYNGNSTPDPINQSINFQLNPPTNAILSSPIPSQPLYFTYTIVDDDFRDVRVGDKQQSEGQEGLTTLVFPVTITTAFSSDLTVSYQTKPGTASPDTDYEATSGTVVIPAGSTSSEIRVNFYGDDLYELDETIILELTASGSTRLLSSTATGTILNDDQMPSIRLSDTVVTEADTSINDPLDAVFYAWFRVRLNAPSGAPVTCRFLTASGTARSGTDFSSANGTLTIPAGQEEVWLRVRVNGDSETEANETFTLNLSNLVGATAGRVQATGTIQETAITNFFKNGTLWHFDFPTGLGQHYVIQQYVTQPTAEWKNLTTALTGTGTQGSAEVHSPDADGLFRIQAVSVPMGSAAN